MAAPITSIKVDENTTVNNVYPKIISYEYYVDGQPHSDQFKTLQTDGGATLQLKETIKIKMYNQQ